MVTVSVGSQEAVLLPDTPDEDTTTAELSVSVVALPAGTVMVPVVSTLPLVYETAVDEDGDERAPTKAVDVADAFHTTIPPRSSVTDTGPRLPVMSLYPVF